MRVVIQVVSEAGVTVKGKEVGSIGAGLLALVGFESADTAEDMEWMCKKMLNMRLFPDKEGKMNLSVLDVQGEVLLVSQFTLYASTKKGNRPSFIRSARAEKSKPLFEDFVHLFRQSFNNKVATGIFGEMMDVKLVNKGPVTIILDSKNKE